MKDYFLPTLAPLCIRVIGSDAHDFLQRMSTNDVIGAPMSKPFFNCFITEKARMVAVVEQINTSDDESLLWAEALHAEKLQQWLNNFLFAEEVEIHQIEKTYQHIYGNLSEDELEQKRIENLVPKADHEITDKFNPLELGLKPFISFNKGCYIGQEVIARLNTYDKVKRTLIGLNLSSLAEFESLKLEKKITDPKKAGTITSMAPTFICGSTNALAVVKHQTTA